MLLTASYCLDLQKAIEYMFSKINNTHYTIADAANNVFKFGKKLYKKIAKVNETRKSRLLNCQDTITVKNYKFTNYIKISLP